MTPADHLELVEEHVLFRDEDNVLEDAGIKRDWPNHRGVYYNADQSLMIWVNIEDHFRVVSTQKGADIGEVFERLAKASKILSRHDEFAHSDTLGFLTCCPSNLGTGL